MVDVLIQRFGAKDCFAGSCTSLRIQIVGIVTEDQRRTKSGGKAPWPGFLLVGELAQFSHYPETRTSPGGYVHRV